MDWYSLLTAALGGGIVVTILDILYKEFRQYFDDSISTKKFIDAHLDPFLKSADEVFGKLRSLAQEDFKTLKSVSLDTQNNDFSSLLFLFAKFWANIEIIRQEGLSVSFAKDSRGKCLQSFLACLESRGVRIIDRISQRAIGELMLTRRGELLETLQFIQFINLIENDPYAKRWIAPLSNVFSRMKHVSDRQCILGYGTVLHALLDTLDPKHHITHDRPAYPEKLSKKTWRGLKYRVFGTYLKFVSDKPKYLGPPKRRP